MYGANDKFFEFEMIKKNKNTESFFSLMLKIW